MAQLDELAADGQRMLRAGRAALKVGLAVVILIVVALVVLALVG